MRAFEYANPATIGEAVSMLATDWGQTEILAGGTDLLSLMKQYVATPSRLVNIKGIAELRGIHETKDGLRIGALVTIEDLLDNELVKKQYAAVHQAAGGIASPQIRNMGTVGGNCFSARAAGITGRDLDCWRAMSTPSRSCPKATTGITRFSETPGRRILSALRAWLPRWWPWRRARRSLGLRARVKWASRIFL